MFAQQPSKKSNSYGGGRTRWQLRDATVRNRLCSVSDASVRVAFQHFSKSSALRCCRMPPGLQNYAKHKGKLNGVRKLQWRANSQAPRTMLWLDSVLDPLRWMSYEIFLGRRRHKYFSKSFRPPSYAPNVV